MSMDAVFKALADPSRRRLLDRLHARNGQTLNELCEQMDMTRQAVTKHLAILEEANLVAAVRDGREKHHFLNPHDQPMTFLWIMMPGGLDRFFAEIGRRRHPGEPAPAPFPRPENIAEIEARTVFGWADPSYNR